MAKKSLILSNDDGRVFIPTTSSFSIDDATENISVTALTASTLKINGLADNTHRLLQINSSGTASVFDNNTIGDSALIWDGSAWVNNNAVIGSRFTGATGGDLSGSIDGNIKVISVANVNAGALPTNHGGTNTSLTANSNHILQVSKSVGGTVTYSRITGSANLYPTVVNNQIVMKQPNYYPNVIFYNTPGTYTWTKPAGAHFARIMLQGAGGGGGGGRVSASPAYGGAGGGSGGFSDIVLNITSVSSITVTVGAGGNGGTGGGTGGGTTTGGAVGSTTSAVVSGIAYSSTGGAGGRAGGTSTTSVSVGGTGLTVSGGAGASSSGIAAATTYGMPSGGGKGNGVPSALSAGGTVVAMFDSTNKNFGYSTDTNNNAVVITLSAGAAGTVYTSTPTKPGFGAGGGGGGATTTSGQFGNGGPGGDGYALIVAW